MLMHSEVVEAPLPESWGDGMVGMVSLVTEGIVNADLAGNALFDGDVERLDDQAELTMCALTSAEVWW